MHLGLIIFYLPEKGFGYLRLEGTREEFHFRAKNLVSREIKKGDLVRFQLRQNRGGYYADGVTLAAV